jgi:hypothetical protein
MVIKYQTTDELGDVEEREKDTYTHTNDYRSRRAFEIYRAISKIKSIQNRNVIDVGGAQGSNLRYFSETNACYVVDYQKRDLVDNVKYLCKTVKDVPDSIRCAAVLFCHTLEHVVDPVSEISGIKNILEPGGILYIEVPFGCWREYRSVKNFLTHINFFSEGSLAHLLDRCGLNIKYLKVRPALVGTGYARAVVVAIAENAPPHNAKIDGYQITRKQMKGRHYGLLLHKIILEIRLKKLNLLADILRYTK